MESTNVSPYQSPPWCDRCGGGIIDGECFVCGVEANPISETLTADSSNGKNRLSNGHFAPGNNLSGKRRGASQSETIRRAILAMVTPKKLKELREGDPDRFWTLIAKVMPKHIKAEISATGVFAEAAMEAAERATVEGHVVRTQLGMLPTKNEESTNEETKRV